MLVRNGMDGAVFGGFRRRKLSRFYSNGQDILLRRQRAGSVRRERARRILRLIEIKLDLPIVR
jgi:hypothetical protein